MQRCEVVVGGVLRLAQLVDAPGDDLRLEAFLEG
jgi:hypothetical protein